MRDVDEVLTEVLQRQIIRSIIEKCYIGPSNLNCRVPRARALVLAKSPQSASEHLVKVGDKLHALGDDTIPEYCCGAAKY